MQACHRRRIPPLVVAFRLSRRARRRRALRARPGHPVPGRADQGARASASPARSISRDHPMLDHFRFLKAQHQGHAEDDDPGADGAAFPRWAGTRSARKSIPISTRSSTISARPIGKAVQAFYDAGCRYLQFDDTVWAYLCSEEELAKARERGDEPDDLQRQYADMINHALKDKPADMTITMHVCRGNFRSTFISSGGYEPVAELLLGEVNFDGYFLEYDTDRAGGFEPLRFLPKGKKQWCSACHLEERHAGEQGRRQAADRRGGEIRAARAVLPVAAMRLRLDRGGQHPDRGRSNGRSCAMIVELADEVWGQLTEHATHQAAVPRRSCRQPAAPRGAEGRARQARARRDHRRAAEGGRGPRDRRASSRSRRRSGSSRSPTASSAARSGTTTSSASSTASKPISASARSSSRAPQPKPMMLRVDRQARRLRRPSDARAFQFRARRTPGRRRR